MYSDQRGFSCKYLASATKTSWSFTMSTATLCGWRPARKNQRELILGCARALEHMRKDSIVLKHQVLDNQVSAAYKKVIGDSDMTYEFVPPEDH